MILKSEELRILGMEDRKVLEKFSTLRVRDRDKSEVVLISQRIPWLIQEDDW